MRVIDVPIEAFDLWTAIPGEEIDRRAGAVPGEQVIVNFLTKKEQAGHLRALLGHQPKRARRRQDTSQVLTAQEAADLLRMDRNDFYKLRLPEALPHRPGCKHRYLRSVILRYMEDHANGKAG